MKVIIYVEGISDKLSLQNLLAPLIAEKRIEGISIEIYETAQGDRKKVLLTKTPCRAVNIIINEPDAIVIILPDLYPKNKGFAHETFAQMEKGIYDIFCDALRSKGMQDERLNTRLKVFCFKFDLESLLLASSEILRQRLGVRSLNTAWTIPVEDQNHDRPPKRIVEELFSQQGSTYRDTIDAPWILSRVRYQDVASSCRQHFEPFVNYLSALTQ